MHGDSDQSCSTDTRLLRDVGTSCRIANLRTAIYAVRDPSYEIFARYYQHNYWDVTVR